MAEPTLFQQGQLQVTRRRVLADGEQYALNDLISVQIETAKLPRGFVALAVLLGTIALFVSQTNGSLVWLAAGVSLLALVGFLWWRASRTYILVLGTATGDRQILTSTDRRLIEQAAQTIDALLVARSRW